MRISLPEIRTKVGETAARHLVTSLLRKERLQRIGRGLYVVVPFRMHGRPWAPSAAVTIAALLASEPYYLGGLWAFTFHRLTSQQHRAMLDVYVSTRRRPRRVGSASAVFHVLPPTAFKYGIETATIERQEVRVSDKERTVLDAFEHPRTVGSIRRALELFDGAFAHIDSRRLVEYAAKDASTASCQRLGLLLERRELTEKALRPLHRRVEETRSLLSLAPEGRRTGPVNARWGVVENDR